MGRRSRHRSSRSHDLAALARRAMTDRGLLPRFSSQVDAEVARLAGPAQTRDGEEVRDLGDLLWLSIDNDDSRDLDQISYAEEGGDGEDRLLVGIADVDALVSPGSAINGHARHNTTSVYTAGGTFPMLPERLSTDLTSLVPAAERLAVVVEMRIGGDGEIASHELYRARVVNHAKLAYPAVGDWLEGRGPAPPALADDPALAAQLTLQDRLAQSLRARRERHGALELTTIEPRPVFSAGRLAALRAEEQNRAKELIEDVMIAANRATAAFLAERGLPSLRRVLRSPERWQKIRALAADLGETLPPEPDAGALAEFLRHRRRADPTSFPDLSLTIVKLMGSGEYAVERPDGKAPGHFGLAVRAYTHSTAPNRRFPDVVSQRLVKAALAGSPSPYGNDDLEALAVHCTVMEDNANKVERRIAKSAAAMLLESRIGERFPAIVTGASEKGTWARIFDPPIEGKVIRGFDGLDVGDRLRVELVGTDVERGFIDFARVG